MQCIFCFFQILDGFVDAFYRFFKAFRSQTPVAPKCGLEVVELGFEVCDVDVLRLHQRQLGFVLK